jgi:phosphopantothenoylcysteine decarboxylase/phosphopantothenate--cysteine ligase
MNVNMWKHPATQASVALLRARGVAVVGPVYGRLASGIVGAGRLAPQEEIVGALRQVLGRQGPLHGRRVVVTAGGTQEPVDPVRHIGNRSSGKMGYALAQAAIDRGAEVTLVTSLTSLHPPYGAQVHAVQTTAEMRDAVLAVSDEADVLLMAAAPADFRPAQPTRQKIKKEKLPALTIALERTPDILVEVAERRAGGAGPAIVVGFAAETEDLLANAADKLRRKRLELVVANDITAADSGFAVDTNRVTLLGADGSVDPLPLLSKTDVAERVLERVVELLTPEA